VTAVMACRSELELGGTTWGAWRVPWADGRVSWMAAPSGLKLVARRTARRMEAANGAKKRAAASQLEARRASLIWNEMQLTICSRASASRMEEGCFKSALSNTLRCSAHGGGRRCQHEGCFKAAQGGKLHCIAHGGGKRCQDDGCCKSALGNTSHCVAHGGGKRCQEDSCCKSAAGGGTPYCVAHGGGKRCRFAGCTKAAQGGTEGGMLYCVAHGVGKACEMPGCPKTKHSDWPSRRRQAVRGGRLPHRAGQGARPTAGHTGGGKRCEEAGCLTAQVRGHGLLLGTRGGQAVHGCGRRGRDLRQQAGARERAGLLLDTPGGQAVRQVCGRQDLHTPSSTRDRAVREAHL
jgi:hypothetical protein